MRGSVSPGNPVRTHYKTSPKMPGVTRDPDPVALSAPTGSQALEGDGVLDPEPPQPTP